MKLFIHFDEQGHVLSVAKVPSTGGAAPNPFLHVERQENVLELDVTEEFRALEAHEIAEQYMVDVKKGHLRKEVEPKAAAQSDPTQSSTAKKGTVKKGTAAKKSGKKKPDHRG